MVEIRVDVGYSIYCIYILFFLPPAVALVPRVAREVCFTDFREGQSSRAKFSKSAISLTGFLFSFVMGTLLEISSFHSRSSRGKEE